MKVPFCLPWIDQDVIDEVNDALTNTGWLTSGPKVKELEQEVARYIGIERVLCVNSWTSGAMLVLKWFGVGPGDEVIIPAYTYSATALCVMNLGATPVMVDVKEDDFNIDVSRIRERINERTKAIIPVDIGGWPCDYEDLHKIVQSNSVKEKFHPNSEKQKRLGRPLILADAAHSIGAVFRDKKIGLHADFTVFSFHSVKNVTAGEGGAVCVNLPIGFDADQELAFLRALALNGQTKSAYEKNQVGGWRYDIIDQGLKINLPDLCAAVALAQIRKYQNTLLPERKIVFEYYLNQLRDHDWTILPKMNSLVKESSCHLFLLRIKGFNENLRDSLIKYLSDNGVGANVHYVPMAMLTLFKKQGYDINDYPATFRLYENEISLPIYNGLSHEKLDYVVKTLIDGYSSIVGE